eukprot:gene10450-biopygen6200
MTKDRRPKIIAKDCMAKDRMVKDCMARNCIAKDCITNVSITKDCTARNCIAKDCMTKYCNTKDCMRRFEHADATPANAATAATARCIVAAPLCAPRLRSVCTLHRGKVLS